MSQMLMMKSCLTMAERKITLSAGEKIDNNSDDTTIMQ